MDVLYDKEIRLPEGQIVKVQQSHLKTTKIIIFFFSAFWVGATEELIDKLKLLYDEIKKRKVSMEIIYVSADTEEDEFNSYLQRQGRWCAMPYKSNACDELRYRHTITCMPQITVCKNDGTVISNKAKAELFELGINVIVTWTEWVQK